MNKRKPTVEEVLRKHSGRIENRMQVTPKKINYSQAYTKFKKELSPELTRYEKWCHSLGNVIKLKVSKKDEDKIRRHIEIAHLEIEPWQALTLSIMSFLSVFLLSLIISIAITLIRGTLAEFPFLFFVLMIIFAIFLFYFVNSYPAKLANKWRLKTSSQMVPAILYIVVYMRHTPNLEKVVVLVAKILDLLWEFVLKKVFYDVEEGNFSRIKEGLENYLKNGRNNLVDLFKGFI